MSRINRGRITDGQDITASDLNDRFDDYSQAGALNAFNVRDAAIDLPQVKADWFARDSFEATLGEFSLDHTSVNTVTASSSTPPAAGHIVQDFGGTASVLNFGLSGVTIGTGDVLRVYWDLSVNPTYNGTPWTAVGALGQYVFNNTTAGTTTVATSGNVWVLYPQWDITSSALSNFVDVPGQSDFTTNYTGSLYGNTLAQCEATTVIPAWVQFFADASDGKVNASKLYDSRIGWRGVSGAWHYSGLATTVYGMRWIIRGLLHPDQNANVNYLAYDTVAGGQGTPNPQLEYTSGKASAIIMRLG